MDAPRAHTHTLLREERSSGGRGGLGYPLEREPEARLVRVRVRLEAGNPPQAH